MSGWVGKKKKKKNDSLVCMHIAQINAYKKPFHHLDIFYSYEYLTPTFSFSLTFHTLYHEFRYRREKINKYMYVDGRNTFLIWENLSLVNFQTKIL